MHICMTHDNLHKTCKSKNVALNQDHSNFISQSHFTAEDNYFEFAAKQSKRLPGYLLSYRLTYIVTRYPPPPRHPLVFVAKKQTLAN